MFLIVRPFPANSVHLTLQPGYINQPSGYLQSYHLSQKVNLCTIVMMEGND